MLNTFWPEGISYQVSGENIPDNLFNNDSSGGGSSVCQGADMYLVMCWAILDDTNAFISWD